ncbi:MAG TPA: CdaR family protein [Candidatus Dormibacteraeota bacterium]|jgi:YbbR domain-containing protein
MSWITADWRLKLLALGLSILMLGAVAFSQNPPKVRTIQGVSIAYSVPADLVVINPPSKTTVSVTGLADILASVTDSSLVATLDLTKAQPGTNVSVTLVAKSLVQGVTVQNPNVPVALNIDRRASIKLTVTARTPRVTPGWQVTKAETRCPDNPCTVTFDGPASWETNLKAYADFLDPVQNSTYEVLTQPVVLFQNGAPLDLTRRTIPDAGLDVSTVTIHIEAKTGSSSRQVVLIDSAPSQGPRPGYRVTNVVVDPITVVITGNADVLVKINTIALPPLDLSSYTSDITFRVTIPYPNGATGTVAVARVTYSISPNPNVQPTPGQ